MQNREHEGRNIGIDALRVASMLMIALMHVLGKGGILGAAPFFGVRSAAVYFLEVLAFPAVNCYALISGYVGAGGRARLSRLALLWAQVALYSFGISLVFFIFRPGTVGLRGLLHSLLPAATGQYWYFTAYFALYLFMPLLNAGVEKMSRRQLEGALAVGFIALSCLPTLLDLDAFHLVSGYSALWLMALYAGGAYLRKYEPLEHVPSLRLILVCAAALLLTWVSVPAMGYWTRLRTGTASRLTRLLKFNSPLMVVAAVCLLTLFARMKLSGKAARLATTLSPLSFSVYLIHTHPLVFNHLIGGRFAFFMAHPLPLMIVEILLAALDIFAVCCAVDALRLRLFGALKLKERLGRRIDGWFDS